MPRVNFDDLEYDVDGSVLYKGLLFTGDAFELLLDGTLAWEGGYESGRKHGVHREYYPTGHLKSEYELACGVLNGIGREWSLDGRMTKETHSVRGICLKRSEADEKGDLHVTFMLTPDHRNYGLLQLRLSVIRNHLESQWKVSASRRPWTAGLRPPRGQGVLIFPPGPVHAFWIYATEGMSWSADSEPLELMLFSPMAADSHVELLSAVAAYHQQEGPLSIGHTVNFGRPWLPGSLCDHGLISLPYLDGPALEWRRDGPEPATRFAWLIPITATERAYKISHGLEALEARFQEGFDYLDPGRKGVA